MNGDATAGVPANLTLSSKLRMTSAQRAGNLPLPVVVVSLTNNNNGDVHEILQFRHKIEWSGTAIRNYVEKRPGLYNYAQELIMSKNLHLEHIEDLMLMFGTDGIKESFDYIDDLVRTFSANPSGNRNISTKWDGAPAIFCGPDPYDGRFFVAKKGIFNKKPKLYKSITEIDEDKLAEGLKTTFKSVFTYMKPIYDSGKLKDVVQGDFLFESGGRTLKRVHGEDCVLFKPQLIVYCIPKHDELYEKAKRCKLCVVIHAKYPAAGAKHVSDLSVNFGFDASQHSTEDCLIISPFTSELGKSMIITPAEKRKLIEYKEVSMRLSSQCGSFLNTIASDYDNKWGVSYLLKQYFNARVREGQKVNSASVFYRDFINYFETKFRDEIAKKAQDKTKAMWKKKCTMVLTF